MKPKVLLDEEHRVSVAPESLSRERFIYLPVDVPAGAAELKASYAVEGAARIDIGVFGVSSSEPALSSFRGWSGSARREFIIQRHDATPGYLAGPVDAGRWHIVLGLYVVEEPVLIRVNVVVSRTKSRSIESSADRAAKVDDARISVARIPGIPGSRPRNLIEDQGWIRGDLHVHTEHSNDADAPMTVAEAIAAAEARGLEFLALSEHNTTSQWSDIRKLRIRTPLILLKAEEVTTYRGHFNAFGAKDVIEFRTQEDVEIGEIARRANEAGAVLSVNHPKSIGPRWEYDVSEAFSAVEAWQAPWPWVNWESMTFWTALLDQGKRVAIVGGSDLHDLHARPFHQLGTPTTWVKPAKPGPAGVLDAIRRGRTMVSSSPGLAPPIVEVAEASGRWRNAVGGIHRRSGKFRVRLAGRGYRDLCCRMSGGRHWWTEIGDGDAEVLLPAPPSDVDWMRIETWEQGPVVMGPETIRGAQMSAVTNAIWFC